MVGKGNTACLLFNIFRTFLIYNVHGYKYWNYAWDNIDPQQKSIVLADKSKFSIKKTLKTTA